MNNIRENRTATLVCLLLVTGAQALLAGGCAIDTGLRPEEKSFRIFEADTRFSKDVVRDIRSEANQLSTIRIDGNACRDPHGYHDDCVYLNPGKSLHRDGSAAYSLTVINMAEHHTSTGFVSSIGRPQRLNFLADGDLISFELESSGDRWDEAGPVTRYGALTKIREYGRAFLTPGQFRKIATAKTLVVKIEGTRNSATFENDEILPAWQENLRRFLAETEGAAISRGTGR